MKRPKITVNIFKNGMIVKTFCNNGLPINQIVKYPQSMLDDVKELVLKNCCRYRLYNNVSILVIYHDKLDIKGEICWM